MGARGHSLQSWLIVACLPLITALACSGSGSETVAEIRAGVTHLPTLTRTPLPTLTPTGIALAGDLSPPIQPEAITPSAGAEPAALTATPQESLPARGSVPAAAQPGVAAPAAAPPDQPLVQADQAAAPAAPASARPSAELPTPTATETPTSAPVPTETPTPEPTATPLPAGWVFRGVRAVPSEEMEGTILFGELTNNTGVGQKLAYISGTFYDAGGQKIPYADTTEQSPVRELAQGGRVPFQMVAPGLQNVANVDLQVQAVPAEQTPRQDFEFLEMAAAAEGENYCLTGQLLNPGEPLQSYLMVAAVLYDSQGQVINYRHDYHRSPVEVVDDQTLAIFICVERLNQEVARYELTAWGQ